MDVACISIGGKNQISELQKKGGVDEMGTQKKGASWVKVKIWISEFSI